MMQLSGKSYVTLTIINRNITSVLTAEMLLRIKIPDLQLVPGEPKSKVPVELIIPATDELATKAPGELTIIYVTDELTLRPYLTVLKQISVFYQ